MEVVIISILIILLITLIILIFNQYKIIRNNNSEKEIQLDELKNVENNVTKTLELVNNQLTNQLSVKNIELENNFKNTTDSLDKKISNQNIEQMTRFQNILDSLDKRIRIQNDNTNLQVKEIVERVSKLDSFNREIISLSENIYNLEKVLNDKKARGTFGEIRLSQIFKAIFGENQSLIYEEQYSLSNGKRVDFILHAPNPLGNIAIDSKFPLDNYYRVINSEDNVSLVKARRDFQQDIKKHINDIAEKYILEGETANQAIMFIPAEAIFSEINSYHPEIINYSYENNVWITSPSTLMGMLNLLLVVLKDIKRNEASEEIYEELRKLKLEFNRYEDRWNNFTKHFEALIKDAKEITTTSSKISKKFDEIEKVEFDNNDK